MSCVVVVVSVIIFLFGVVVGLAIAEGVDD